MNPVQNYWFSGEIFEKIVQINSLVTLLATYYKYKTAMKNMNMLIIKISK